MVSEKVSQDLLQHRRLVFVSGCYDILHAGHLQFFTEARALGDYLIVSFASAEVLFAHKRRRPSLPDDHKKALIQSLRMVDEVVIGRGMDLGLDFKEEFFRIRPNYLVVTDDDKYAAIKLDLCSQTGCQYIKLPKTPPQFTAISTTEIVRKIRAPEHAPLRVDFAGGWLDVPRFARSGAFVINCAITPMVSLSDWPYELKSGLGGSGAWAALNGKDGVTEELNLGVGWQDPAIISEGGLCVWRSGDRPQLEAKFPGSFLRGKMALYWTGVAHDTPGSADIKRDYDLIAAASSVARDAAWQSDMEKLAEAVRMSYSVQLGEGMRPLPGDGAADLMPILKPVAFKYCGGGHGGYAVYLFSDSSDRDRACQAYPLFRPIEPCVQGCR